MDSIYATYLPRGHHPFVYMSLTLPPQNLDVNVHPTKHEVHFLYQEEIVDSIKQQVEARLLGSNATRTFYKQLRLPGAPDLDETQLADKTQRIYPKEMVRTDSTEQKLDKFWRLWSKVTQAYPPVPPRKRLVCQKRVFALQRQKNREKCV